MIRTRQFFSEILNDDNTSKIIIWKIFYVTYAAACCSHVGSNLWYNYNHRTITLYNLLWRPHRVRIYGATHMITNNITAVSAHRQSSPTNAFPSIVVNNSISVARHERRWPPRYLRPTSPFSFRTYVVTYTYRSTTWCTATRYIRTIVRMQKITNHIVFQHFVFFRVPVRRKYHINCHAPLIFIIFFVFVLFNRYLF